jgi:hypothetical protein
MSFPSKYKHPNMHKPLLLKFWNGFGRYLLQIHCTGIHVVPHQHNKRYSCSQGAGGMLARITSTLSL